jgi:rubrerythrin
MPDDETTNALFDLAIGAEIEAMHLYNGLAKRFSHHPEVANFWHGMLQDEIEHAQHLERVRSYLKSDQLQAPADQSLIEKAKNISRISVEEGLSSVETLDDAYELANEFEHSEVNRVFTFLMSELVPDEQKRKFAFAELQQHLSKLMDFSKSFGDVESRKKVKAFS